VVDDLRENADFYAEVLRLGGFAVNRAYGAHAGLRLARLIVPDAMLLNQLMPEACGLEILAALRRDARTRGIKVLITSALAIRDEALAAGAVDFLSVPVKPREITERVERALYR
jgi:CheY-like chemotaxis protein